MGSVKALVTVETCVRSGERVTSPRSLEACRRSGIDPDELLPKTVSEFLHQRADPLSAGKFTLVEKEAAVLRQRRHEQNRQAKLEIVCRERAGLLQSQNRADAAAPSGSPVNCSAAVQPLRPSLAARRAKSAGVHSQRRAAHQRAAHAAGDDDDDDDDEDEREVPGDVVVAFGGDSTMVQLEERRLAKMKQRHQREIRGVIEAETKLARIQQENARRSAEETRRRDEFDKELRAKRALLVANKHAREMAKQQQEEREAAQRRLRAKELADKEKRGQEEERERARERQQEAAQREHERALKADEFKRQTEALLQHQEDVVAANRQRMLEKERQVAAKVELATRRRHQEAVERREKASARIQQATAQNQLSLERKKSEIEDKQASAVERAREVQRKTLLELRERSAQQHQDEQVRLQRLDAARQQRETEVGRLLSRRQEAAEKLARAELERERARQLLNVEKSLVVEEKQQNVERLRRRAEYERLQLLARIADEDARSRDVKAKKLALVQARKQLALDALVRKHRIGRAMEQLRWSNKWDKVEETLSAEAEADDELKSPRGRAAAS